MTLRVRTLRIVLTPVNCLVIQSLLPLHAILYEEGICLKVVFPTCCGVDVHKKFLVATIIKTPKDSLQPSCQKKRFFTFNADLNRFADWLHQNECLDVCMESPGSIGFLFLIFWKSGKRDKKHQLSGVIEFDDSYFGGPTVGQKRGAWHRKSKGICGIIPEQIM